MNSNSIESLRKIRNTLRHWHLITIYLLLYDIITIAGGFFLALWVRFDCHFSEIPPEYMQSYFLFIGFYVFGCIVIYELMNMYRSIWRYVSYSELYRISLAVILCLIFNIVGMNIVCGEILYSGRMPISYYLFGTILQFIFAASIRFSYRFILLIAHDRNHDRHGHYVKPVLLYGAGNSGRMLMKDLKMARQSDEKVCCIIDDNPNKWGRFIDGVPVEGGRDAVMECVEKYHIEKIYVAIPSASRKEIAKILNICKETGCELLNLPGMYQLYTGEITVSSMKEVSVEDLLGRDPIKIDMEEIFDNLQNKTILVTGGGGSIGSELCRQIADHSPKKLVIFDIYENNAYDIQLELQRKYPDLDLDVIIGSVRDSRKIFQIMETYRPQLVYHAAAHKHVPLMEDSPCESIKNNASGTYKTAFAAMTHGCEKFVLISTDKAVNPTNVMGASKRLCEMIIQAFDHKVKEGKAEEIPQIYSHNMGNYAETEEVKEALRNTKTEFVAVRFGNVLASNGSVIPLFKRQIMEGGPVTVTHPDIIRYFMTIPEAVSLVLQAGTYAKGGEIFVLDMGEPVRIDDLARNLIKLSGHKPDVDIEVKYVGLRPGEKLYEEKLMEEEGLKKTKNELIHIGSPIEFDTDIFLVQLNKLMEAANKNKADIRTRLQQIVVTYNPEN